MKRRPTSAEPPPRPIHFTPSLPNIMRRFGGANGGDRARARESWERRSCNKLQSPDAGQWQPDWAPCYLTTWATFRDYCQFAMSWAPLQPGEEQFWLCYVFLLNLFGKKLDMPRYAHFLITLIVHAGTRLARRYFSFFRSASWGAPVCFAPWSLKTISAWGGLHAESWKTNTTGDGGSIF